MEDISWGELKNIIASNPAAFLYYVDAGDYYIVWTNIGNFQIGIRKLFKYDASEFESVYKTSANPPESERVRVRTSMENQFLHSRFFSFDTSDDTKTVNNNNHRGVSFGDMVYEMYDSYTDYSSNTPSESASTAKITTVTFAPLWSYSIENGKIKIPSGLTGEWELHVIALPDTPLSPPMVALKDHPLVANPSLELEQGGSLELDASMNHAYMPYTPYRTNVIRFVVVHPVGESAKFQIRINLYTTGVG